MTNKGRPSFWEGFFEDMFLILSILMFGWPVIDGLRRESQILILILLGFLAAFIGLRSGLVRKALRTGLAICGLVLLFAYLFLSGRFLETSFLVLLAVLLFFAFVAGRVFFRVFF